MTKEQALKDAATLNKIRVLMALWHASLVADKRLPDVGPDYNSDELTGVIVRLELFASSQDA